MYFDKDGTEIDLREWSRKRKDNTYCRVAEHTLADGTWISTVWLGVNYRFLGDGSPLIFETMVFRGKESDLDMERYSTQEEAKVGHQRMVRKWSAQE